MSQPFDPKALEDALRSAANRIIPNRRKMSLEDAHDIVRRELERHHVSIVDGGQRWAQILHRGPMWPFLHPLQARREGMRFGSRRD